MATIQWGMTYSPRAYVGGALFEFPQPVMSSRETYGQTFKTIKIPLQNGVVITGISRSGLTVTIDGIINKNTRSGVLHTKQRMIDLFIANSGQAFTFYRYFDAALGNYRWFEDCVCQDLTFSSTNRSVYNLPYSMTFIAPEGYERQLISTEGLSPGVGANISGLYKNGAFQGDDDSDSSASDSTLPANRTFLYGPLVIKLTDTAGASAMVVQDSNGDNIFRVGSDGVIQGVAPLEFVSSIASII